MATSGAGDGPGIEMDRKDKVKERSSGEEEVEVRSLPLLSRVLGNGVVGERIASFLTLTDLKAVSEVSKDWCRMVRSTQRFGEMAMLLICKETVGLGQLLVDSEFPWKAVEVDVTLPVTVVEIITDILATVSSLHLRLKRTDKVEGDVLTMFLTGLLTNTPELKCLKLESVFLEQILHDVLSDVRVQETLKKLKRLEICTGSKMNDATHYLDFEEGEEGPFPRNFYQLSCIPLKLESLILGKICTAHGTETEHVKFIPDIIASNSETLVQLSVHMAEVWKLETMKTVLCPHLKRLTLTAYGVDVECVSLFLTNQPHLEHLSVIMKDKFCTSLLTVIRGKCAKLRSLALTAKLFKEPGTLAIDGARPSPLRINWDFLSGLHSLKEFSIRRPACDVDYDDFGLSRHRAEGTGVSFLKALPSTVKHLRLRGLNDFWFDVERDERLLELAERIALLSKFQNLSSLTLFRCDENFLDDDLVQFILGNFTKLQRLEISHGSGLSNMAIMGRGEVQGVTLKNLKSLVHLKLKGCNRITGDELIPVLEHPYLRSLEYLGCYSLSRAEIIRIVSQNPSLESIAVPIYGWDETGVDPEFTAELNKINGRLCKVVNLVDEDGWAGNDSDSDADDIRGGLGWDGDSDISGGGMPGDHDYDDFCDEDDDEELDPDDFDYC